MSTNIVNQVAYLKTSREFPQDADRLSIEVNKSYVDIANAVNNRTISIFPTNRPAITGESWFITSVRQQPLRRVYLITGEGTIPHQIPDYDNIQITRMYGQFTDGTFWYPLPWVSVLASNNNVNVFVSPTNIVITGGGGPAQPVVQSGFYVLEWINRVKNAT